MTIDKETGEKIGAALHDAAKRRAAVNAVMDSISGLPLEAQQDVLNRALDIVQYRISYRINHWL